MRCAGAAAPGGAGTDAWIRQLWNQPRTIQLAPFTAAVFRAAYLTGWGYLMNGSRSYLEDVDFGLRCAEAGFQRIICPGGSRLSPGQRDAGPVAPGHGAKDCAQSVTAGGETLSAELDLTLWLASSHRSDFMGIRRAPARGAVKLRCGQGRKVCAQFRGARGKHCPRFPAVVEQSENEIREIQQLTGFDLYWRLYFALT